MGRCWLMYLTRTAIIVVAENGSQLSIAAKPFRRTGSHLGGPSSWQGPSRQSFLVRAPFWHTSRTLRSFISKRDLKTNVARESKDLRGIDGRGRSGLVHLSETPPERSGTSVWCNRETGSCVAPYGKKFDWDVSNFDLAFLVENRFNRLVLFRENVLHRAEQGFGTGLDARLTRHSSFA
jgi:hypothetical protein